MDMHSFGAFITVISTFVLVIATEAVLELGIQECGMDVCWAKTGPEFS